MSPGLTLLPGRIAVLTPTEREQGPVLIPDSVREKWHRFGKFTAKKHEAMVAIGEVVAVGRQRGKTLAPRVGDMVVVLDKEGLQIEHNDVDIPTAGAMVPAGFTLRIYRDADSILTVIEESKEMVMAA